MRVAFSALVLGLGWFAVVNAAATAISLVLASRFTPAVVAEPRRARRLAALRLLPSVAAAVVAAALFAPAHVRLEPEQVEEKYGVLLLVCAAAGLLLFARSAWRVARVFRASRRLRAGLGAAAATESDAPIDVPFFRGIALAGIFRPRVLIGRAARHALTDGELDAAIAHERAHQRARDNLTRVLFQCAPDFLGLTAGGARLERLWEAESECLADARATRGDRGAAVQLASALVKVARLAAGSEPELDARVLSTFHHAVLLETRVRLLLGRPVRDDRAASALPAGIAAVAGGIVMAWLAGLPGQLHAMTEILIRALP